MLKNDELEYGTVLITKGKYKNQIGYYDDDDCGDLCIVYLGTPFLSPCVKIKKNYLVNTEIANMPLEKFKKANPTLCLLIGIK